MNIIEKTEEIRNAPPILLKITQEDRKKAERIAASKHLKLTTWVYTVFKEAIEKEKSNEK